MASSIRHELLFRVPRSALHTRINDLLRNCDSASAAVGFLTEEGVSLVANSLQSHPRVLTTFVIGALTHKACDGLDRLLSLGVSPQSLYVNLGHSRSTGKGFVKYHPMMHSKVYLFESSVESAAIIGSHNMTGFAFGGQNTEASLLVEGPADDKLFADIRSFIQCVKDESQQYNPEMRHAYAWWYRQFFEGMQYKVLFGTGEEDVETRPNVVAISIAGVDGVPRVGDVIYLEIPLQFQVCKALREQVHFYILPHSVDSVNEALKNLPDCELAFKGSVIGTNTQKVIREGRTDWIIRDLAHPTLERAAGPVTPTVNSSNVQAFIKIDGLLHERYKYIFDPSPKWVPVFDESKATNISASPDASAVFEMLNLTPAEHIPWQRVIGLTQGDDTSSGQRILKEISPVSGRYVVYSRRRLKMPSAGGAEQPLRLTERQNPSEADVGGSQTVEQLAEALQSLPAVLWFEIAKWAKANDKLLGWQRSLAYSVGQSISNSRALSGKQAMQARILLIASLESGFTHAELDSRLVQAVSRTVLLLE